MPSLYAMCKDYLSGDVNKCGAFLGFDVERHHSLGFAAFFVVSLFGLVNNIISIFVFFQNKYDSQLIPFLLRMFYICNFAGTLVMILFIWVTFLLASVIKDATVIIKTYHVIQYFFILTFLQLSDGILAYTSIIIVTCIHSPGVLFSKRAYRFAYFVLIVLLGISFGLQTASVLQKTVNLLEYDAIMNYYYIVTVVIATVCSVSFICYDVYRRLTFEYADPGSVMSNMNLRRQTKYVLLSCVLFILTTLPAIIYLLLPKDDETILTCQLCRQHFQTTDDLKFLMSCGLFFHNLLYCFFVSEYRNDVRKVLVQFFFNRDPSNS